MRDIILGNGVMLLNFDENLSLRDLYWPYGGFENHGDANHTNFGFFADQRMSWIFSPDWEKKLDYVPDTSVTRNRAVNNELGLEVIINDALHSAEYLYLKKIVVRNLRPYARNLQIIFYQDFSIRGIEAGDSAFYDPRTGGVCHYKKGCYLLVNCRTKFGGVDQYSTGIKRYKGREGTFKDAEDGCLSLNPIADGSVDSAIGLPLELGALGESEVYFWLTAGFGLTEVREANRRFLTKDPEEWLERRIRHYRSWIMRARRDFGNLSPRQVGLYKSSLFTMRSSMDRSGAVMASSDADNFLVARDHYMYFWPRDGAMVAHGLDMAGYPEEARRIYSFCAKVISEEGYFLQRYNPDGSPGCTWHPMVIEGEEIVPIQEDETALVLWALGRHYQLYNDAELVRELYRQLIRPALNFMTGYLDQETGLVGPSWDLWEERRGITAFTCGAVYGALILGADMARTARDEEMALLCENVAAEIREGMVRHLYHPGLGRFVRGLFWDERGKLVQDSVLDASMYGLFAFGAFSANDVRICRTMQAIEAHLWCRTEVGGLARYIGDYYYRVSDDIENVPGNPWIITTLWLADWHIALGGAENLARAYYLIDWVAGHARPGNLLPEQLNPYSGDALSVCPLTWSHSTYVKVVLDYLAKCESVNLS